MKFRFKILENEPSKLYDVGKNVLNKTQRADDNVDKTKINLSDVVEIRLMTKEQASKTLINVLKYHHPWWLSTPASEDTIMTVNPDGSIDYEGSNPCNQLNDFAIRPIIYVRSRYRELNMGDIIEDNQKRQWIYLGGGYKIDNLFIDAVFLLKGAPLLMSCFNDKELDGTPQAIQYDGSKVDRFLNDWLKRSKQPQQ